MNRKPLAELIPVLAKGIGPTTAVATGLLAPVALGASGDLDPEFADGGRSDRFPSWLGPRGRSRRSTATASSSAAGTATSLSYWYECAHVFSNFASVLTEDGTLDAAFAAQAINDVEALDVARQADGQVVAVGRKTLGPWITQLVAFRLGLDGALDTGFGASGIFELSTDEYGPIHRGAAVALEPDGKIVIAGAREIAVGDVLMNELIVLRLLADGSLDPSFGTAGAYVAPAVDYFADIRLRAPPRAAIASRRRRIRAARSSALRRAAHWMRRLLTRALRWSNPLQAHRSPAGRSRLRPMEPCS